MARTSKGIYKAASGSSDVDSGIISWEGGICDIAVQGDLGGGTVKLYVALDVSEETKANFAEFTDDAGVALSLSGPAAATAMRSISANLPKCNCFLRLSGNTSADCNMRMSAQIVLR